nr:hypothetical protein [Pseudomonas sp. BIGb0427]
MSSINALGVHTPVINPTRGVAEAAAEQAQFRPPVPTSSANRQQQSQANTSQQSAEDAREEAFAKLKVQLQNPDVDMREQATISASENRQERCPAISRVHGPEPGRERSSSSCSMSWASARKSSKPCRRRKRTRSSARLPSR